MTEQMDLDKARKIMDCIPLRVGTPLDMRRALDAVEAGNDMREYRSEEMVRDFVLVRAGEAMRYMWKRLNPHDKRQPQTIATVHDERERLRADHARADGVEVQRPYGEY